MVNIMDINIIDLNGKVYDINSMYIEGNDVLNMVIKSPEEEYIGFDEGRELVDKIIYAERGLD